MNEFGFLNIHKAKDLTSRAALNIVQRLARPARVGHAGTLDPLATGVLLVAVGPATRLIEHVQKLRKTYRAEYLLGRTSPTEDVDGPVEVLDNPPRPSSADLNRQLGRFTGRILQRPPAYSALKVGGKRAYALARSGAAPKLGLREVEVYRLELVEYDYPRLVLTVECGGGTYVRSLGRDLAASLGTAAVMSALVRTSVGPFRVEESLLPEELARGDWTRRLIPPEAALCEFGRIQLSGDLLERLRQGQVVPAGPSGPSRVSGEDLAVFDDAGRLVALARPTPTGGIRALRNLIPGEPRSP